MQTSKAHARFVRISPRKVRLVVDLVRGKSVAAADAQLLHLSKKSAEPVRKLIASAAANAVNNHGLIKDALYVKAITVDQGPTIKRFHPRAFGRAGTIRKRTSHISVELAEREAGGHKKEANAEPAKGKTVAKKTAAKALKKPSVRKKAAPKRSKNQ